MEKKPSTKANEEQHTRHRCRVRRKFKALVRKVIANLAWLQETEEDELLTGNVKRNVQLLTKKKDKKSLLSLHHKTILMKPSENRTEAEKHILYRSIGSLKCFRRYPDHVKRQLAAVSYFYYYGPNRVIVRQDHVAHALYFVVSGTVSVSTSTIDPILNEMATVVIGNMVTGSMFGEVSLLHDIRRTATITTTTPCELIVLLRADFDLILKQTVQAQWDEVNRGISQFEYFNDWDVVARREFCILARKRIYKKHETLLGDASHSDHLVFFVLRGRCQVIEHLLVSPYYHNGKKHYVHYEGDDIDSALPETTTTSAATRSKMRLQQSATAVGSLKNKSSLAPAGRSSRASRITFDGYQSMPILLRATKKKLPSFAASTTRIPSNVETHFMEICQFSATACFNLGENMKRRRIVAMDEVECLVIPKYWLMHKNYGNLWTRVRCYLDMRIPTTKQVFQEFMVGREWHQFRRQMRKNLLVNPPANKINNVPYSIRISEDIDFVDRTIYSKPNTKSIV